MKIKCPYCKKPEGVVPIGSEQISELINGDKCVLQVFSHPGCEKPDQWNRNFGPGIPRWTYRIDDMENK